MLYKAISGQLLLRQTSVVLVNLAKIVRCVSFVANQQNNTKFLELQLNVDQINSLNL